ncbi:MAG: DUF3108 domain-containing protein [Nitrosospira sp.]
MKFLFVALIWGLSFPAFTADLPTRVDISYLITSGALEGEVNDTLEIRHVSGTRSYIINSEARATGLLALTQPEPVVRDSKGTITAQGALRPGRFSDQHGKKLPKIAIFDWGKNLLTLQYKGREEKKALPPNAQDRLSLLYSFVFSPVSGEILDLHETDGKKLEVVRYAVSRETLETPMGELETIVLTKQKENGDDRDKKIWLAVDHYMLPVRIVATQKLGLVTDQIVTKIDYADKP